MNKQNCITEADFARLCHDDVTPDEKKVILETVVKLQSILFGRHLLLGAKLRQKTNLMRGSAGTETWKALKALLVKLDVV